MKGKIKKLLRRCIIQLISLSIVIRLKFLKPQQEIQKIVFINVNNYPDNFSKILEILGISRDNVINIQDKWDSLLKAPLSTLQRIVSADVIVATGDSPIFYLLKPQKKLIYLWHACGAFKQMGIDAQAYTTRKPDWVVVSAEGVRPNYAQAFGVNIDNVVALGIPRTEVFQDETKIQQTTTKFLTQYPQLHNKKIYLYVPTYRENPFRSEVGFDLNQMSKILGENEVLIYKQHPAIIEQCKTNPTISNFSPMQNILCMDDKQVLELTMICDVIMTDYSSAFLEAMLLDKPCVFCANDIDIYEKQYYINYREDLPGTIVEDGKAESIINALRTATIEHPNYKKFKEFHLGNCQGSISQRVVDFLKEI